MDPTIATAYVRELLAWMTGDEKHDESSTSTLDTIWVLYDRVLRVDPSDPHDERRDRFILSKGHGPAAYYAILAAKGFFPEDRLGGFLEYGSPLGSHPDRSLVPGTEVSTGSLGHGLPIGIGVALALRAKGLDEQRVVVLCGDAELNEGSCWEAILLAPHLRLSNLTLLVSDNHSSSIEMSPWDARVGRLRLDRAARGRARPRGARTGAALARGPTVPSRSSQTSPRGNGERCVNGWRRRRSTCSSATRGWRSCSRTSAASTSSVRSSASRDAW